MKNKVMKITVMLAVVLAMTGMAAANPESIVVNPADQQITPGGPKATYSISITGIFAATGGNTHTIKATTSAIISGSGTLSDLQYQFVTPSGTSGWLNSGDTYTWTDTGGTSAALTLKVKDTGSALNTKYQFKVYDSYPVGSGIDEALATVYGTSIPEFPTIAIPAGAAIRLLLLFRRRRKEE